MLLGLVLSCGQAVPTPATVPAPVRVLLTPKVQHTLDSAWVASMLRNAEAGLCVASGGYAWDAQRRVARVWKLALTGPQAARIDSANTLNLWWHDDICGDTLPSWHSHLSAAFARPSLCDRQQFAWRARTPFWLVQSAPGVLYVVVLDSAERRELRRERASAC